MHAGLSVCVCVHICPNTCMFFSLLFCPLLSFFFLVVVHIPVHVLLLSPSLCLFSLCSSLLFASLLFSYLPLSALRFCSILFLFFSSLVCSALFASLLFFALSLLSVCRSFCLSVSWRVCVCVCVCECLSLSLSLSHWLSLAVLLSSTLAVSLSLVHPSVRNVLLRLYVPTYPGLCAC